MPKVYVISRPTLDENALQAFLQDEATSLERTSGATQGEEVIEVAGRLCYLSFGQPHKYKHTDKYIAHLIEQGHESVLEHISWSVILTGITRACSHQIVRHRVGFSFSQLSQQYYDESNAEMVSPVDLTDFPSTHLIWKNFVNAARQAYKAIVNDLRDRQEEIVDHLWPDDKCSGSSYRKREVMRFIRSIARSVLPNATETKMMITANARAWRHFFTVRGANEGDVEMRLVSAAIFDAIVVDAPSVFADFERQSLPDGTPKLVKSAAPLCEAAPRLD
jgi:thymidylate synthase (FAD)